MKRVCGGILEILWLFSFLTDWLTHILGPKMTLSTLFCDAYLGTNFSFIQSADGLGSFLLFE